MGFSFGRLQNRFYIYRRVKIHTCTHLTWFCEYIQFLRHDEKNSVSLMDGFPQFFAVIVVGRFFQGGLFDWKNERTCRNMLRTECDPCTTRTTRRGKYIFVSNAFSCTRRPVRARTVFSAIDAHTTVSHYDDRLIGDTVTQSCNGVWRSRVDRRRINEKNSLRTRSIPFENALRESDEMTGIGKCSTVWN